jgi:hypothetical protein
MTLPEALGSDFEGWGTDGWKQVVVHINALTMFWAAAISNLGVMYDKLHLMASPKEIEEVQIACANHPGQPGKPNPNLHHPSSWIEVKNHWKKQQWPINPALSGNGKGGRSLFRFPSLPPLLNQN